MPLALAARQVHNPRPIFAELVMFAAVSSCWALLLGLGLLMLGNGLQGTLLGVRASLEGFPTATTGLVMTGYFAGYVAGSFVVPRLVHHVGHVRVFAALASLASAAVLLHAVFVVPVPWFLMRVVTGFCFAGLYLVTESWLNDVATNENRGQLLSVYMVVMMGGMSLGQLLLNLADPRSFELFVLISVLVSLALVPMLLSVGRAPEFSAPERIGLRRLYRASPLGVVGAFSTGVSQGAVFGMGAVFASDLDFSVPQVAWFMTAVGLGAVILQWPIGRASDAMDRRKVIVVSTALATALAAAAVPAATLSPLALILAFGIYGGISVPLYSLFIAHTNDHLQPRQRVAAGAGLVMLGGLGAVTGPVLCAAAMDALGPMGFLALLGVNHAAVTVFGLYRMLRRDPVPLADQESYPPVAPRGTLLAGGFAGEALSEEPDGETARGDDEPSR